MPKKLFQNGLLVAFSLFVCFLVVEGSLRLVYPKYQYAADPNFELDEIRIWKRSPEKMVTRQHPDRRDTHTVIHNELAMRQHRSININDLKDGVGIGFFGDSFTENLRLPAPYSFTEPLGYLLNENSDEPVTVLNFGVDGYGTDQSYLTYHHSPLSADLDFVFYIMYMNDLRNIYENNLFSISSAGELTHRLAPSSGPWLLNLVSSLHTVYLLLEIRSRILPSQQAQEFDYTAQRFHEKFAPTERNQRLQSPEAGAIGLRFESDRDNDNLGRSIEVFRMILRTWRAEVESNGGQFIVVGLPRERHDVNLQALEDEFEVLSLYDLAIAEDPNVDAEQYWFKNDGHWNEAGNLLAAKYFYRHLGTELNLSTIESNVTSQMGQYYSAFPEPWQPDFLRSFTSDSLGNRDAAEIQSRYLELDATHF